MGITGFPFFVKHFGGQGACDPYSTFVNPSVDKPVKQVLPACLIRGDMEN